MLLHSCRVKYVEFLSEGFMVEIPKYFALADVAIRLMYRSYDTMSERCSTFHPNIREKKDTVPLRDATEEEKTEKVGAYDLSFFEI